MKKVDSVDAYIKYHNQWSDALTILRDMILKTDLEETLKWSAPVYSLNGKNVVGISAFKNHFGLWFFNGVFLKDKHQLLINAQEGKTKALRQIRFHSIDEIDTSVLLDYVEEAIENQKSGKILKPKRQASKTVEIPSELEVSLNNDIALKSNFEALSNYKQKEYCEYIATAKREATKQSRLEKIIPMIKNGIGLHDKYRNC